MNSIINCLEIELFFVMKKDSEASRQSEEIGNPGMVPCGNESYHFHELTEEIIEIHEKKNRLFQRRVNLREKLFDLYNQKIIV